MKQNPADWRDFVFSNKRGHVSSANIAQQMFDE